MTCEEAISLAGAHALGALEDDERAALEAHLATPGPHACRAAVDRARAAAAELARAIPEVKPGPEVWAAIEARAGAARRRVWVGPAGWLAVAAAAAAFLYVQLGRRELRREGEALDRARAEARASSAERDRVRAELQALAGTGVLARDALALLARPGTRLVPLLPGPGQEGRAVAILDAAGRRALVASSSLPPWPGKTYQLWVIRGAAPPRPAGFLTPSAGGGAAGEVDPALLEGSPPDALAVSLEPAGGSPAPTQVVLVGRIAG